MTPAAPPAAEALAGRAREVARERAAWEPAWLALRRREALARFEARGFPTTRDEDWKYTSLVPLSRAAWSRPAAAAPEALRDEVARRRLPLPGAAHVVLVDGRLVPSLSSLPPEPQGLRVESLDDALRSAPSLLEPWLARVAAGPDRPLCDLSTACFEGGLFLHVARGTCLPVPVDVLHLATGEGTASFPRTLVVAEPETRVTVVERFLSLARGAHATLPVTEVVLARNAVVEHAVWQEQGDEAVHAAAVEARQDRDSRFASHALTLGAAFSRNDTRVLLDGEGAECSLDGLYFADGDRHADHHTVVDHARPHGISRELFKGILDGRGTGVFNGRVVVRPGAQKTDSQQANHNLLLSDDAVADTKPELEIYADDVKCAHGATVGRLDDDKIFYLRSRGFGLEEARDILVRAFARDVADRVPIDAVHALFERWMDERLSARTGREEAP